MSRRLLDFLFGAVTAAALLGWWSVTSGVFGVEGVDAAPTDPNASGEFLMSTGTAAHGGALLFVLNTKTQTLSVYEAEGGSRATRGVTFVASRKIARDLYVSGYNDKSEYSYQDLVERIRVEEGRKGGSDRPIGPIGSDDDN